MSSLQVFIRLGLRRWARMVPPMRNIMDTPHKITSVSLPEHTSSCYFSSKEGKKAFKFDKSEEALHNLALPNEDVKKAENENNNIENSSRAADELIAYSQQLFSNSFAKSCEYLLTDWSRQVRQLQNEGSPFELKTIVSKKLPYIVNFVLTPSAPVDLRNKCLILLLSEQTDQELTSRILNQTIEDAAYLPIRVLADIVNTLSTSFMTPLRKDARIKLVTAVINQRWYDIPPKFLIFFMYQLDELFDMKIVCKQQRQKDKQVKPNLELDLELNNVMSTSRDEGGFEKEEEPGTQAEAVVVGNAISPVLSIHLEMRATRLANDLKVKDLARMVILLAKWRNRNETLLNTIVHCLSQADLSDFSFVQLNNLLFSFSVLHFHNDQILGKLALHLAQLTPTSPALTCSSLASLSHLRFNDAILISKYLRYLADHISELTVKDAQSILMSLANLYAVPTNETESNLVLNLASRVFSGNASSTDRVNCAWCLAILISLGAELGESLLQPEFVNQISGEKDTDDFQKQASLQKLSSINTAFQFEVKGYSGPLLSDEILHAARQAGQGCTDKALQSELVNTLRKFVDLKTYTSFGETLKDCVAADVVMCANSSGEFQPLQQAKKENEKVYKLAIQLIPFSGVLNVSQSPSGSYSMSARHLKHQGYVPVQILYSDLKPVKTVLEKFNNLKAKITTSIHEVSAVD